LFLFLFTSDFTVKTAECDAERLQGAHRIVKVTCEHVLVYAAELHHNVLNFQ
jgi:hypothetical protein